LLLLAVSAIALVAMACSTGAYPVDVFTEMHYHQSYKSQEPPRLGPAEGSAPFTIGAEEGQELTDVSLPLSPREPATQTEALVLTNPVPNNAETLEAGKKIFVNNCAMCHGLDGSGQSYVSDTFASLEVKTPANFAEAGSIALSPTDSLAFWFISDGLGNMPAWRNLLTQEERWTVIHYLRYLSDQANQ
jgi:mono/diheme cytochrome c family protein